MQAVWGVDLNCNDVDSSGFAAAVLARVKLDIGAFKRERIYCGLITLNIVIDFAVTGQLMVIGGAIIGLL